MTTGTLYPLQQMSAKTNAARVSFCTVKLKHPGEGTTSDTHFRVEGLFILLRERAEKFMEYGFRRHGVIGAQFVQQGAVLPQVREYSMILYCKLGQGILERCSVKSSPPGQRKQHGAAADTKKPNET